MEGNDCVKSVYKVAGNTSCSFRTTFEEQSCQERTTSTEDEKIERNDEILDGLSIVLIVDSFLIDISRHQLHM
jgi:hypothetical protein